MIAATNDPGEKKSCQTVSQKDCRDIVFQTFAPVHKWIVDITIAN
jgi:hypothetical protein